MSFYAHITNDCLSDANRKQVEAHVAALEGYETILASGKDTNAAPVLAVAKREDDLAAIETLAADIKKRFKHVVICGAGGSGLSGQVLANLRPYSSPRLYALDNIDPAAIEALLEHCAPQETFIIAISKSGGTAETLAQFYAIYARFKKTLGDKARDHLLAITTPGDNPMRRSAKEFGVKTFDHPTDIGGRFTIFTVVGLLPAAIAGINIRALRKGAANVLTHLGEGVHAACLGAALQFEASKRGHTMSVMLPYCERMSGFSAWYRQSWAESLGKGGKGTTPICAVGTTDQHSQLQLYLDGPNDKFFTMILHARAGTGQNIEAPNYPELAYLKGHTTGDVMEAEQRATLATLARANRPVRLIEIKELTEETLGALIMHFMLEIFFMAKLLGVNAFDQPAVEEGKQRARDYLLGRTS